MLMADSSQTRDLGKVDGQFLHARWWLLSATLDAQILLHFRQGKVWAEDDWEAARSVYLLRISLRLQASLPRIYDWVSSLMSASCLGPTPPAAIAKLNRPKPNMATPMHLDAAHEKVVNTPNQSIEKL